MFLNSALVAYFIATKPLRGENGELDDCIIYDTNVRKTKHFVYNEDNKDWALDFDAKWSNELKWMKNFKKKADDLEAMWKNGDMACPHYSKEPTDLGTTELQYSTVADPWFEKKEFAVMQQVMTCNTINREWYHKIENSGCSYPRLPHSIEHRGKIFKRTFSESCNASAMDVARQRSERMAIEHSSDKPGRVDYMHHVTNDPARLLSLALGVMQINEEHDSPVGPKLVSLADILGLQPHEMTIFSARRPTANSISNAATVDETTSEPASTSSKVNLRGLEPEWRGFRHNREVYEQARYWVPHIRCAQLPWAEGIYKWDINNSTHYKILSNCLNLELAKCYGLLDEWMTLLNDPQFILWHGSQSIDAEIMGRLGDSGNYMHKGKTPADIFTTFVKGDINFEFNFNLFGERSAVFKAITDAEIEHGIRPHPSEMREDLRLEEKAKELNISVAEVKKMEEVPEEVKDLYIFERPQLLDKMAMVHSAARNSMDKLNKIRETGWFSTGKLILYVTVIIGILGGCVLVLLVLYIYRLVEWHYAKQWRGKLIRQLEAEARAALDAKATKEEEERSLMGKTADKLGMSLSPKKVTVLAEKIMNDESIEEVRAQIAMKMMDAAMSSANDSTTEYYDEESAYYPEEIEVPDDIEASEDSASNSHSRHKVRFELDESESLSEGAFLPDLEY